MKIRTLIVTAFVLLASQASASGPETCVDLAQKAEQAKRLKESYLKIRCATYTKTLTDPLFTEFETKGLAVPALRAKIDEAIQAAQLAKTVPPIFFPRPSDKELDEIIDDLTNLKPLLETMAQTPVFKDTVLRCQPQCQTADRPGQVSCTAAVTL